MSTITKVPVVFIDDQGNITSDMVGGLPCVRLELMAPTAPGAQTTSSANWYLLDTGADYVYVASQLVQGLALPLDPSAPPVNTNFAAASSVHVGVFVIPGATKALNIPVVSTKVSQVNRHLGGILGRQFLGGCKLTYDGPAKSCELVYHEV